MLVESKENLIEGIDYKFEPELFADKDTTPIRILSGDFANVIVKYGLVEMKLEDELLKFDYDILEHNNLKDLATNPEFQARLGDILVSILTAYLEGEHSEAGGDNNKGTNQ